MVLPASVFREPQAPVTFRHRLANGKVQKFTAPVVAVCGACAIGPVVELPPEILAEQPDDTTHACVACGHGFTSKPEGEP